MKSQNGSWGMFLLFPSVVVLLFTPLYSSVNPSRVDFYDKSNNHLMFMTFHYNAAGVFTGRTVYMADSTFKREVLVTANDVGERIETSYDFNGDVSFVTKVQSNATTSNFTVHDQFNLDHVGGPVSYSITDPLNFNLSYADNSFASRLSYSEDASGNLQSVDILDQTGTMQYYGIFSSTEVKIRAPHVNKNVNALIKTVGQNGIDLRLNLKVKSVVKCELATLNGKIACVLFDQEVPKGDFSRTIKTMQQEVISQGVYMLLLSVNGKTTASTRYLSIASFGGAQ